MTLVGPTMRGAALEAGATVLYVGDATMAMTASRPLASATLGVAEEPESGRLDVEPFVEFVRDRARGERGERVLDVAAMPSRVVGGDAVLRIVDTSRWFRRQVSRRWTWFILPPGTGCTIACQLESSAIAHFDELADMATDIANSVSVTLEPA